MKLNIKWMAVSLIAGSLVALTGCVQYPTERQSVVDLRPQISFRFDPADARLNEVRVLVDGLDSGRLGDFVDGKGALRVLSGSHGVQIGLCSRLIWILLMFLDF
jgi:hypothetical protein